MDSTIITGLGLSSQAGLNAYVPLLVIALVDRFSTIIELEEPYDLISSTPGIIILLVLLTIEVVVDKIPGVDHANDLLQSIVRPVAGAILMMSTTGSEDAMNPAAAMVIGLLSAGSVHAVKAISRPVVTVSTGGIGNPLVSTGEDFVAAVVSVVSVLAPYLAIVFLVAFGIGMVFAVRFVRRLALRIRARQQPTNGLAQS